MPLVSALTEYVFCFIISARFNFTSPTVCVCVGGGMEWVGGGMECVGGGDGVTSKN